MSAVNIYPEDCQSVKAFQKLMQESNPEKPVVEMDEVTSRDINVIWPSINMLAIRWRGGKDMRIPGMPTDRKEFWGGFARDQITNLEPFIVEFIESRDIKDKIAIDLGCGNSSLTKDLLRKGWRVLAVDNSRSALDILISQNLDKFHSGKLFVIEEDITTYVPLESADLVIALDSLPYTDPSKFQSTWKKIHDTFLKENGYFIGSLFRESSQPELLIETNIFKEMGAWFLPDRRMVRPLLTLTGYEIKKCQYRKTDPNEESTCIQFIAEKKNKI